MKRTENQALLSIIFELAGSEAGVRLEMQRFEFLEGMTNLD